MISQRSWLKIGCIVRTICFHTIAGEKLQQWLVCFSLINPPRTRFHAAFWIDLFNDAVHSFIP